METSLDFSDMSEEKFLTVIYHPKLKWNDNYTAQLLRNNKISEPVKLNILSLPDIDVSQLMARLQRNNPIFLDELAEDFRVLSDPDLQRALWSKIIDLYSDSDLYGEIKKILAKKTLDPSIDYNFPLRTMVMKYYLKDSKKIAQLLLDDDRVVLMDEPFDYNLIIVATKSILDPDALSQQIEWILSQPKFKREWFEITARHLLFDQLKDVDLQYFKTYIIHPGFIFIDHQFDEYLSEEIRANEAELMKPFIRYFRKRDAYFSGRVDPDSDVDE